MKYIYKITLFVIGMTMINVSCSDNLEGLDNNPRDITEEQLKGNAKFFFVFSMINLIFSISSALIFVVALKWGATGRFLGFSITAFIMA